MNKLREIGPIGWQWSAVSGKCTLQTGEEVGRRGAYAGHVDHAGLARGAGVVARVQQLLKAGAVEQVAAVRDVARDPGRVDVLQAHRAVGTGYILHHKKMFILLYIKYSSGGFV